MATISVVINTFNEERNISLALRSVYTWADEIVVADMYSDDRTVEIAEKFGAKVFLYPRTGFVEAAREFAVSKSTGDWIFLLDADEVVPPSLSAKFLELIAGDSADVFMIPRLNYLFGAPVEHTGWGPFEDRQLRLYKRDHVVLTDTLHGGILPARNARVVSVPYSNNNAIHHFNYIDSTQFIDKMNRYTTIHAQQAGTGMTVTFPGAVARSMGAFVKRYILKKGYRDGWRGFYLSGFMAAYKWITYAKLEERAAGIDADSVQESYRKIAERIVASYPGTINSELK